MKSLFHNIIVQQPFITMLYVAVLLASDACSIISKDKKKVKYSSYFLYLFMEAYYVFVILCSVAAMDKIHKNKNKDSYKFNKAAISLIIILTFLPYIVPMVLKTVAIIPNIVPMLMYLGLGASCSTSNFLIAKLWNAAETSGGQDQSDKKCLAIIIFFLFNLFFGSLNLYNYNRKKRANSVMGLAILFLLYNFFRIAAIAFSLLFSKDIKANETIEQYIRNINGGIDNPLDYQSEQKKLKENDFRNANYDNYENNGNNENNGNYENNEYNGNNGNDDGFEIENADQVRIKFINS